MDIERLLQQLTIEEKVLLSAGDGWWHTNEVERLGIPPIRLSDGPNGVRGTHFFDSTPSACLPCGTALGATFDTDLIHKIGGLLSEEAHAKGAHVLLGPTVNIQRGPLGGRGFESFSEDPLLSGVLAGHYVRGVQQSGVSATLKHFVCNDMESQRMAVNIMVTDRALREIYLLPFMIAIEMGRPRLVMTAYNKVNGCHAAEHRQLIQEILRDEWKFDGLVTSDWFGTYSTSSAIKAGLDLEMPGPTRWRGEALKHAIAANKIKRSDLDERVRNILKLIKHAIENTSIPPRAPEKQVNTAQQAALLRETAAKSIVLLKNEQNILPFDPRKSVAVIGPNANIATYCGGGSASLRAYSTVTPLQGIRSKADNVKFSQGAYGHLSLPQLGKSLRTIDGKREGFVLRVYNEPPPKDGVAGLRQVLEERVLDDSNIWFVDYENPNLASTWYAETEGVLFPTETAEWEFGLSVHGTGQLFINDQLVVSNMKNQRLGSSFLGSGTVEETGSMKLEAGQSYRILVQWGCCKTTELKAEGVVNFGQGGLRFSGCPKLNATEAIQEAVEVAKSVDQVVLCVGTSGEWESEGQDRATMALPPGIDELVLAILAANPNTAVVVQSGTPVTMPWIDQASAVLQAWFGGNQGGNGIADVLFGAVNPAAKLPITIPRRLTDNPSALSFRSDNGRVLYSEDVYVGYRWYDTLNISPLFPFGHGLSYTTFELSNIRVMTTHGSSINGIGNGHSNVYRSEDSDLNGRDTGMTLPTATVHDASVQTQLYVQVEVSNIGSCAGAEVVQVYVTPATATPLTAAPADLVTRPTKELKGFTKVHVEPGSTVMAEITLDVLRATSYWSEIEDCWISDAGEYSLLVGTSSRGEFLRHIVIVEESTRWRGLRTQQ